jgi:hypothetical protein
MVSVAGRKPCIGRCGTIPLMDSREAELRREVRLGSAAIRPAASVPIGKVSLAWFAFALVDTSAVARRLPWDRWSRRRRLIARVASETLFRLVVVDAIVRWSARQMLRQAEVERRLSQELGRAPTPDELERALQEDR